MSDTYSGGTLLGDYSLKVVGGTMRGREFPIKGNTFSIGRSRDADIVIHDTLISRVHSKFIMEGTKWFVEDLNSTNGTWVGETRANSHTVVPENSIVRIGKTIIRIHNKSGSKAKSKGINEESFNCRINPHDFSILSTEETSQDVDSHMEQMSKTMQALCKLQKIAEDATCIESLAKKALNSIEDYISFESGVIFYLNKETGEYEPLGTKSPSGFGKSNTRDWTDQPVIDYVAEKKESVLSIDHGNSSEGKDNKTAQTSLICAPIFENENVTGIIYLVSTSPTNKYTPSSLKLLTALAHSIGVAIKSFNAFQKISKTKVNVISDSTTLSDMAHLVRNIMAAFEGSLNLMSMGLEKDNMELASDALKIMGINYRKVCNLSLDLVEIIGDSKPSITQIDVCSIIENINKEMEQSLQHDSITLNCDNLNMVSDRMIDSDSRLLPRAIKNLILVAQKAIFFKCMEEELQLSGEIIIRVKSDLFSDFINLSIEDNGKAVDEKYINRCFDMETLDRGDVGSALELAVCKKILDATNSKIKVSASNYGGACFTISIPVSSDELSSAETMSMKLPFIK